ncbi:MAG: right-handed parallel beta-helix repeat-containing protein [Thermodesulfobacteriota bacterium]|nr:right-handed parallel beta-helix repeat-containing protein [Thermodesulfobacteriota bacterium]
MNRYSLCSLLVSLMLFPISAFSATIRVPADQPTIQAGIGAASSGDVVLVADGVYTGSGNKNLDFQGKAITVQSENGPWDCVIDCEGEGRGFHFQSGEGQNSVVAGIAIVNGYVHLYPAEGGGILCRYGSSPTITSCIIAGNWALYRGGGIECYYNCSPAINDCIIVWNATYHDGGGGISCLGASDAVITNCLISENESSTGGGGVYCRQSSPAIANCIISDNSAYYGGGGGIHCSDSDAVITNCTITNNVTVWEYEPFGGFACSTGAPIISNSILWANSPLQIGTTSEDGPTVSYSNVQGGYVGDENIDADPRFEDPENGFYYLLSDSPCIDAGNNDAVPLGIDQDIEGDSRIVDGDRDGIATVDMGADEYADTDGDLILDVIENMTCTDPLDADTDDDGIQDGEEDSNQNGVQDYGETDPCEIDTDNDGIQDGTESGRTVADVDPSYTNTAIFQPDLDPASTTDPTYRNTDRDRLLDGEEDTNCNGRVDEGETDPAVWDVDPLSLIGPYLLLL